MYTGFHGDFTESLRLTVVRVQYIERAYVRLP